MSGEHAIAAVGLGLLYCLIRRFCEFFGLAAQNVRKAEVGFSNFGRHSWKAQIITSPPFGESVWPT
jgi:hypothetical protein